MRLITLSLLLIILFLTSCAKDESKIVVIEEKEIDLQMIDAYSEGVDALDENDGLTAAKKFSEAELLFPQSIWAPRAALMSAYAYYSGEYYADAVYELERFLKTYPRHPRTDYAYYLLAISYYDQIIDETKDLNAILKSKIFFEHIISNYPNTDYAMDSIFKLELINEVLASKEMYLARYYFDREKWIPAIHYKIGLEEEAKKYAYLLGYNYQSSEWYEKSYKIFNKGYVPKIKKKKNKNSLIDKIKTKIF